METSDFLSASEVRCAACEGRVIFAMVAVDWLAGALDAFALASFCRGSFMRLPAAAAPRFESDTAVDMEP